MAQKGGRRRRRRRRAEDPALEPLCCCEYIGRDGARSHVAACICDCQELDDGCDRWISGKPLAPGAFERILDTISDRCRIPWLRGARKVDISILPPLVLLPALLHVAAWHLLLGVVILASLPALTLWYYYLTHRRGDQTLFFLSLGLFSLGYMYYTFLREVAPRGRVGPAQLATLTCGLGLTLLALRRAKEDPGYLRRPGDGAAGPESPNGRLVLARLESREDWCTQCRLVRPARAGHCRLCQLCVRRMDHHCVWINNCVGESNHRAFLLALSLFLLTSGYGIALTLGTICPERSIFTALFYCPGVYATSSSALSFTCSWYCAIITAGMGYIFLIQLINISCNVTEREAGRALRGQTGRRLLCGLGVDPGQYNRGFLSNWRHFCTLGAPPRPLPSEDVV
ncbi:palmitoyltransferase ZDHHC23 isoform X2 [Tachyglossus aculeatus]|uniref:palmitoyltransferase ZDHHC23 isoform X2 n=1 Tax=Tachyglossus aculeatus TaxID=9261 RepID=UPI0018F79621|nr:palmitoyltransferase ZDHHC23 isoform X2 [Tachyglossus aculeatus]